VFSETLYLSKRCCRKSVRSLNPAAAGLRCSMQPSSDATTFPSGVKSYVISSPYNPRDMGPLDALRCRHVAGTVSRSLQQDGFFLGKRLLQGVDEVQNLLKDKCGNFFTEDNRFFMYEVGVITLHQPLPFTFAAETAKSWRFFGSK
jgi:hypothetical protein